MEDQHQVRRELRADRLGVLGGDCFRGVGPANKLCEGFLTADDAL